jgi:hypothetical protein
MFSFDGCLLEVADRRYNKKYSANNGRGAVGRELTTEHGVANEELQFIEIRGKPWKIF